MGCVANIVSSQMNTILTSDVFSGEVFTELKKMAHSKAPGLDGILAMFFKKIRMWWVHQFAKLVFSFFSIHLLYLLLMRHLLLWSRSAAIPNICLTFNL